MSDCETRSDTSLLDVWEVRVEDGSPLSMAGDVRGHAKLQGIHIVSGLHELVLLVVFRSVGVVGMG